MYIKTKDGIYEVEWNSYVEMWCDIKTHKGFILDSMFSKEDYILADTIEELCDEFVRISHYQYTYRLINSSLYYLKHLHEYENDKVEIYGCIWTEKGLIYVAKTNENGELVLI